MAMNQNRVTVTFEYEGNSAPKQCRLDNVVGGRVEVVARRAIAAARKQLQPHNWWSCVVVIERNGGSTGVAKADAEGADS
jgi:hypothetical protein